MKLAGAALLTLAGLLGGLLASAHLRAGLRRREELCRMLAMAGFELERFRTPLPELFSTLGERFEGAAGELCRHTARSLSEGEPFAGLWRETTAALPEPERACLAPLGEVLGRYGAQEQTAALMTAERDMRALRDETAAALGEKSRVYTGLFTAGGLLLAVLLM